MIRYRFATNEDNQQLIAVTASSGMAGETALRIDRNPDFFELLALRGETRVFVALDDDTIIGCLCVSLQPVYVSGEVHTLQYIGDFKVAKAYRNKGIGLQLCDEMANYVVSAGSDLAFLNVSKGNSKPLTFFKNRPGIPDFENIGLFHIHQFIGRKKKALHQLYKIEEAPVTDKLIKFLNAFYCRYELGPVIKKETLKDSSVFIVRQEENIIAAMCLVDTMRVKQNVVMKIPWKMKLLIRTMNMLTPITGFSKMPQLQEPVRMMYIKYLAVNDNNKALVRSLVDHARNIVYDSGYSFASIGLHEKDPLHDSFRGLFKVTFKSMGMLVSIKNTRGLIEKIKQGIPFEDYSLV